MPTPSPHIALAVRNAVCTDCRLGTFADGNDVCVTGSGNHEARIAVVTKTPLGKRGRSEMEDYLTEAGIPLSNVAWLSAIKCRVWDQEAKRAEIKACKKYLDAELAYIKPEWVLSLGNEALSSLTGHSGIMKYRGGTFKHPSGAQVFATIAPAMIGRNPGLRGGFLADLRYFNAKTSGVSGRTDEHPPRYVEVMDKASLREMISELDACDGVSIDIESTGPSEFDPGASIVSVAFTVWTDNPKPAVSTWALPLYHPESPWRTRWRRVLEILAPHLRPDVIKKVVAHNGKFDLRWLRQFGVHMRQTFDTLLAIHLLDENAQRGLKPASQQRLGAEPWAIDTKNLLSTPIRDVLWYNALDTWNAWRLYGLLKGELLRQPRLARLFAKVIMPASNVYVDIERHGVWVDVETLATNHETAKHELAAAEEYLSQWVPDDKPYPVNYNTSNFLLWWLYEHLGLPVIARTKTGKPSAAEATVMELAEIHPVGKGLLERGKWSKYCTSFLGPYSEQLDSNHRIHTSFKLYGTVTGRTSSGKEEEEKITAKRQIRGVNMQQVPRDPFVRGIFGAPPGWSFVEADFSQIELRIAAFLACEETMLHLYATGQDIHMAMAMRMTGKPKHDVAKEERKKAKAVNFGFLYGMGWAKFVKTAWENYGIRVTEAESRAFRTAFFDQFPKLVKWHGKQRMMVNKYARVESPIGRIRHLPDIRSPHQDVRAEAERQAINSPVQSFASDLLIMSMVDIDREFRRQKMRARPIGTVHDSCNFEIPDEELSVALPLIKTTMENLPLAERFKLDLTVPIVADLKVGTRWGGARELTEEEVYAWSA